MNSPSLSETPRTKLHRLAEKEVKDPKILHEILDASYVAHVAVVDEDGQPFVLPQAYARVGNKVLFHGSSGSRLYRALAAGAPTCLTVTRHDGMVLARSGFESSMLFRCVMVLGSCREIKEHDEKVEALRLITEHLFPGRWAEIRWPSKKELAAALVLELPLDECSVKVATQGPPPQDEAGDIASPTFGKIWAGVVPISESFGVPLADANAQGIPVPDYVTQWTRR